MKAPSCENRTAADWAYAVWGLARRFAEVRGKAIKLQLLDGEFIRDVHIAPIAIACGLIMVERWPQPLKAKSGPGLKKVYDLEKPMIDRDDAAELAALAKLLELLNPYFQTE